ncbi:MAG TPA: trehalose-phosphatase [Thermoanaerobaculia bacterium]|nr:trehalose-phosphatase [Thermoanaerobaculia bacterium]
MTASPTLLAFDFDGTLAPIRDDPAAVQLDARAAVLLAETSQMPGVTVAILSGRDMDDLAQRIDFPAAYIVASHGLEIRAPGGVIIRDIPRQVIDLSPELREDIAASGLRLERKKHATALHWRGIPYEAISPLVDLFRTWAEGAGLDLIEGRCVLEARCAGGGKEDALRWLARAIGARRIIYAGDDITDFGPLRFAAQRGRALFVASSERQPPAGVTVVNSSRELFRLIRREVMV